MLAKKQRLPIQTVASPNRVIRAGGLTLKAFPTNLPYSRFGVIVPKAVAKTAVLRNRLKRAAFSVFASYKPVGKPADLLCIVGKGVPLLKDAMMEELLKLLQKLST